MNKDREQRKDNICIDSVKLDYLHFIEACQNGPVDFGLTPRAESTAYARCFAVFGLHLLRQQDQLDVSRTLLASALRNEIRSLRGQFDDAPNGKPYRQLLTFTLSALSVLNALEEDPLADLVAEQLPEDIDSALKTVGAIVGRPQSGNHAMFLAIFLLYAGDYLGIDVKSRLGRWVELHLAQTNHFGFWGSDAGMRHLLFQNGYHQYEILEFLSVANPQALKVVTALRSLADTQGHFAPYPGGGGCYDYDAVFMLTPNGKFFDAASEALLRRTVSTLLSEQTDDGGWGESRYIRPRSLKQLGRFTSHVVSALPNFSLFRERLRYALVLQRPCHDRIHTHWSLYSRRWDEADLWDSWFRMLSIARIQVALDPVSAKEWGFIDFPGIGFHPSLREDRWNL